MSPEPSKQPDPATAKIADGWIDAHVHVWTSDKKRYPRIKQFAETTFKPAHFPPEELLKVASPTGVKRIVLIQMIFYGYDNSNMLDTMQAQPGVFAGVAQVDEEGNDPAAKMRRLKKLGVRGVRISQLLRKDDHWLDRPGMQSMWKCGGEERIAICPLINPDDLPAIDGMCEKYPDTPVVIDHTARIGGNGTIDPHQLKQLCKLARHKNTYVKLSAFYFLGGKKPPYTNLAPLVRQSLDAFGSDRLMWGSDAPFQLEAPNSYQASLELIRDKLDFLSNTDKAAILRGTAEKVFFAD